jgi:hypothetical protein
MTDTTNIAADWANVATWTPLFLKRKKAQEEIQQLESEKERIKNSPLSREETKERLKSVELGKVVEDIAISCSRGEDLNFLVNKRQAVEIFAVSSLIGQAIDAIDEISDEDWPADALDARQRSIKILACDEKISKLQKELDLKKIGNKRLIIHNEAGEPIAFRPDSWVQELADEVRQTGPTHDDKGNPRYSEEKLAAMKILAGYL